MNDEYLTTGQVARLFAVSPRTAANWFDLGRLKGYRLPGSGERRYRLRDCVDLAQAHGIPIILAAPPARRRRTAGAA